MKDLVGALGLVVGLVGRWVGFPGLSEQFDK